MNSDEIPLDDETQLYCDIGLHGWCELIVLKKGEPRVFRVSEVFTDFPSEMLAICKAALDNSSLRVALCDEPGGIVFEITPDTKQQHTVFVSIYEVEGSPIVFSANEEGRKVLSTRLRRQRLVAMILAELWKTHMSLKQPSFQKGRSNFPHSELRKLNARWHESSLGPSFLTD